MNFYNDDSRKISKTQKFLIIISFIIIIWGIYFVIHIIYTIDNNTSVSNSLIYASSSSSMMYIDIWQMMYIDIWQM